MNQVNIREAKAQLARLIELAESGEDVVITRSSEPVVRLVKVEMPERPNRQLGTWRGLIRIADDFNDELDEDALPL